MEPKPNPNPVEMIQEIAKALNIEKTIAIAYLAKKMLSKENTPTTETQENTENEQQKV